MKQTAVEWLVNELNQELNYIPIAQWDRIRDIIQRAKEMEKEQLKKAYCDGNPQFDDCAEEYYNETYEKNKV